MHNPTTHRIGRIAALGAVLGLACACKDRTAAHGSSTVASSPAALTDTKTQAMPAATATHRVEIVQQGSAFTLLRGGKPYTIVGIGGRQRAEEAVAAGANSLRTWGAEDAEEAFAVAARFDMTVFAGVWLSHKVADYNNEQYKAAKRAEVTALVERYKNNPQLLVWALGNEIQLGANVPEAWRFVEELAQLVRARDPHHPIATVTAHAPTDVLNHIAQYAPSITLLGVNSYAGLPVVPRDLEPSQFKGPFVITEWGPDGHWEVPLTTWGRPIEQSSAEKARLYAERQKLIASWRDRCLGGYVFLWGQKQERTPTWYGLFLENKPELGLRGEATAQLDALTSAWSGRPVAHPAPQVSGIVLNTKRPQDSLIVPTASALLAQVEVALPLASGSRTLWELLPEPTQLGEGGSHEDRPARLDPGFVQTGTRVRFAAPAPGEYRLFAYVFDGRGKVGTANFPFKVAP